MQLQPKTQASLIFRIQSFATKANEAVDRVGKSKGLTGDTVAEIKRQILGIRLAAAAPA